MGLRIEDLAAEAPRTGRILPEVTHGEYHERRLGVISKSGLDRINRSPAHYKAWVEGLADDGDSPALRFGSAFHCAIFEPERFAELYVAEPDFGDCRFKENKRNRDAWRAENVHKVFVDPDDINRMSRMAKAVMDHPLASRMIRDGKPEVTVRWVDEETGLPAKLRADYWVESRAMVVDLKTAEDARPEAFRKSVAKYRYHVQDALYREGFQAAGAPLKHFVFVVVEKEYPHGVACYALDTAAIGSGYRAAREDIKTLAACFAADKWDCYPSKIQELTLPPWAA